MKHERNQAGFAHLVIVVILVALISAAAYMVFDKKRSTLQTDSDVRLSKSELRYEIYPRTSDAPTLKLYWGKNKKTTIDPAILQQIEKFGAFENIKVPNCDTAKDPGAEWALHFNPGSLPIYAYAPGTVTNVQNEGEVREIVIRFGTSYAVKYLHVAKVPENIVAGKKIEAGTLLGYTQFFNEPFGNQPGYEFWELEVNKIINDKIARTDFPLNYFDSDSKAVFEKLRESSGLSSWFVNQDSTDDGWLAYTGKPEAWADISKLGVNSRGDDYCQFLRDNKLI